jgi:polysaccharide export outer membrane protein
MRFSAFVLATLVAVPGGLAAQSTAPSNPKAASSQVAAVSVPDQAAFRDRAPRYQLRRGDSFDLQFEFAPEFDQTVSVQPDGYITLKSVGTIIAEGFTIPELTKSIQQAYSGILHNPVVTIDLKSFEMPYFIATGQVGKPGKYDLRSDLTVTEGVAIAGGFTEASKHSQVVLFHPGPNGRTEARVIDVKKMLHSRDLAEDIHMQPGDMIYVPQNRISKIQRYLPTSSLGMYGYPGTL